MHCVIALQAKKAALEKPRHPAPTKSKGTLDRADFGKFASRLTCIRGKSEDFQLPAPTAGEGVAALSVVLAVHSHCPLTELWERMPRPRLSVSLPCCGQCGTIPVAPTLEYIDEDILSPHRRILIHFDQ